MGSGLSTSNPAITSAFHAALLQQGLVVFLIAALVAVAWNIQRAAQFRRAVAAGAAPAQALGSRPGEAPARRLLRVSFGLIWALDGILQAQAAMPLGLTSQVTQPADAGSPGWVVQLVNNGAAIWDYHPVSAAAAAVWIQVGLGVWLLAAPRGDWSRLAGLASAGWGILVWIFGEAFGGIFAPGLTWLFGAPGAVLFYCGAGALVALPESAWRAPLLGKAVLRVMGVFFVGMALLQAWPGRGFWQGRGGQLTSMVKQMAQTPQPDLLSGWLNAFGSFDAAHGWAVNLFVVVALGAIGAALASARPSLVRAGVVAGALICLADWVLVQDLGFLGGLGTDPNSMVPVLLVIAAGYLALTRPAPMTEQAESVVRLSVTGNTKRWWGRFAAEPAYAFRSVAALGAIGVVLLGAVPMAIATAAPRAGTVLAQAVDGAPQPVDHLAPNFSLVNEHGERVTLADFRGKVIALTFLDDTCTTDCPVIASELRLTDQYLGSYARKAQIVAINANPRYVAPEYLAAFDNQEGLGVMHNWDYLTGSLAQLEAVWRAYGEEVVYLPAGAMIGHSEYVWVIDSSGHERDLLDSDPGPASSATESSFSAMLTNTIESVLHR